MSNDIALQSSRLSIPLTRSATNNSRYSMNSQSMYGVNYGQAVVGQDFASKINISDLAIKSTAFKQPPPPPPAHRYAATNEGQSVRVEDDSHDFDIEQNSNDVSGGQRRAGLNRRVTFNMDNVQIQTIPAYSSSDASSDEEDEVDDDDDSEVSDEEVFITEEESESESDEDATENEEHKSSNQPSSTATLSMPNTTQPEAVQPSIGRMSISSDPVYQPLIQKTGFWYPLNPPLKRTSSLSNRDSRYERIPPLPHITPLAVTEKLISDTIEREKMALRLDTSTIASRKDIFIDGRSPASATFPSSPALSSDGMSSILICDSDEEDEQQDTTIRSRDPVSPHALRPKLVVSGKITDLSPKAQMPSLSVHLPAQLSNAHTVSQQQSIQQPFSGNSEHKYDRSSNENYDISSAPPPRNQHNHNTHPSSQHDEENSVFSNPPPSLKTDFSKSIYNEFAKRHNQELIPLEEYEPPKLTFPFEQEFIPVSAVRNCDSASIFDEMNNEENSSSGDGITGPSSVSSSGASVHSIDDDDEILSDPVWIDYTTSIAEQPQKNISRKSRKFFFVKVIKAENLDFPIENNDTHVYCSIRYKNNEIKSRSQKLRHTVEINSEMIIQDIDPDEQITITLHVSMLGSTSTQLKNGSWYHKIKHGSIIASSASLERYIHDKDGSLCQTLLLPHRFMETEAQDQLATLMLVNNWYRHHNNSVTAPNSSVTANPSSLLKRRSSSFLLKRKQSLPDTNNFEATEKMTAATAASVLNQGGANSIEKAVGKLFVQCLHISVAGDNVPGSMNEALEALNANRFYNTTWQAGHLTQLGGNAKHWSQKFFTLTGGSLFAYSNETYVAYGKASALYEIPLARAVDLLCNHPIRRTKHQQVSNKEDPITLMKRLESIPDVTTTSQMDSRLDEHTQHQYPEEEFQLVFDNGTKIRFKCGSAAECQSWVSVIEIMMCRLPILPDWIESQYSLSKHF